jgi:hypothetical protein
VLLLEDCPSGKCQSPTQPVLCTPASGFLAFGRRIAGTAEPVTMAGRYQGYHLFRDEDGESRRSVEVFWEHNGWFWRPRFKGRPAEGEAVGPFTTSTQAYESAKSSGQRSPIAL